MRRSKRVKSSFRPPRGIDVQLRAGALRRAAHVGPKRKTSRAKSHSKNMKFPLRKQEKRRKMKKNIVKSGEECNSKGFRKAFGPDHLQRTSQVSPPMSPVQLPPTKSKTQPSTAGAEGTAQGTSSWQPESHEVTEQLLCRTQSNTAVPVSQQDIEHKHTLKRNT